MKKQPLVISQFGLLHWMIQNGATGIKFRQEQYSVCYIHSQVQDNIHNIHYSKNIYIYIYIRSIYTQWRTSVNSLVWWINGKCADIK